MQRPPEALQRSQFFFFGYLVAISFPTRIDVWFRFCTKKNIVFFIFFEGARKQKGKGGRIVITTDISKEVENNTIL